MKSDLEKLYSHIADIQVAMMTTRRADGHLQSRAMATQKRALGADLWFVTLEDAHKLRDLEKAPAYLRSIVLNLARDSNRRGLVSLRHHLPSDDQASVDDQITLREDQQRVIEALRELPHRQRDCLVLRYYDDLGIDDIASTLGISRNSVKTHLGRALRTLERELASDFDPDFETTAGEIS